jgi:23S rRNA pseudouridine2605 synthase
MAIPKTKKTAAKKTVKSNKAAPIKPVSTDPKPEQAADKPNSEMALHQGTTLQDAEKLDSASALYQGTTLVVPHEQQNKSGTLAPEGASSGIHEADFAAEVEATPATAPEPEFNPGAPADGRGPQEAVVASWGGDGSSSVGWNAPPPAKLLRLQKILAQAGVASRRKAEQLIEQGRIQVNGKVVTVLGTKADAARDHIRVDGKLLQGAERLRYFVLNKPRGFVTTVKDPEGRPTVMQFFDKMRERLYPVGRLDYLSEGLLLVTNDGELAHRLTRAAAGVEKTYLVKVAGQPTEAELDILRGGISIPLGQAGSRQVHTSPARIRQVRQGDNPWYEVVLIEGRNRELRKMFEQIGHFVEKIRRVGYGPLVLDQEPGNLRELYPEELELLRKAADGTLRTPQSKEIRRRNAVDAQLPTLPPRPTARPRPAKPFESGPQAHSRDYRPRPAKPFEKPAHAAGQPDDYRPRKPLGQAKRSFRRDEGEGSFTPRSSRPSGKNFGPGRPAQRPAQRPVWKHDERPSRPPARFAAGSAASDRASQARTGPDRPPADRPYGGRPVAGRTFGAKPASGKTWGGRPSNRPYPDKPAAGRTYGPKPPFNKPVPGKPTWSSSARPSGKGRSASSRREFHAPAGDSSSTKPSHLHIEPIQGFDRPSAPRPRYDRPSSNRPYSAKPDTGRSNQGRSNSSRPFHSEGGPSRPFTTSSGKPRPGGPRPPARTGWKPKPSFGGQSKPTPGGKSRSQSKSGPRPGGGKKSGHRPGGKRPGGAPGAKRRR